MQQPAAVPFDAGSFSKRAISSKRQGSKIEQLGACCMNHAATQINSIQVLQLATVLKERPVCLDRSAKAAKVCHAHEMHGAWNGVNADGSESSFMSIWRAQPIPNMA